MAIREPRKLTEMRNIGTSVAKELVRIGVHTPEDLIALGPLETYLRIVENNPGKTMPVCYYLYTLEGALSDVHWNDVPTARKRQLKADALRLRREHT